MLKSPLRRSRSKACLVKRPLGYVIPVLQDEWGYTKIRIEGYGATGIDLNRRWVIDRDGR